MSQRLYPRAAAFLALLAGCGAAFASPDGNETETGAFQFYKDRISIPLNTTCVAICLDPTNPESMIEIFDGTEIDPSLASDWHIPHWSVAQTGQMTGAELRTTIEAAVENSETSYITPVYVDEFGGPLVFGQELFIGFAAGVTDAEARRILSQARAGEVLVEEYSSIPGVYCTRCNFRNGFRVLECANRLAINPLVRFAEPLIMCTGRSTGDIALPDDPAFGDSWALNNTGQSGGQPDIDLDGPEAWQVTTGDPSITTVIIDVGVESTHPDLAAAVIAGADFTDDAGNGDPISGCDRHGTAVAGCIGAQLNNGIGTAGIAPGTSIASARALISIISACDGLWFSESTWSVDALEWAEDIGARVSVNSNEYGLPSAILSEKYLQTRANGMVHFASSGNRALTRVGFPASSPAVLAVTAVGRDGLVPEFANTGCEVALSAPGAEIVTTDLTSDGYSDTDLVTINGTSFSAPYAAGVAALVLSQNPFFSASQVERAVLLSASDLGAPGPDGQYGAGMANAAAAIDLVDGCLNIIAGPEDEDCDNNGFADLCEILNVPSFDRNRNSILDKCEGIAACPCDIDDEPGVTVLDLLLYIELYMAGDPAAEMNCDGETDVTVEDLLEFVDCWLSAYNGASCPENVDDFVVPSSGA